jgi:RHS repeat-associated protein
MPADAGEKEPFLKVQLDSMSKINPSKAIFLACIAIFMTVGLTAQSAAQTWSDNFDRANSTNLGSSWTETNPDLEISSNQIRNVDAGTKAAQFTQSVGPDQDVSVDCKMTAAANMCAVMARWSNQTNFYHVRLDVGAGNLILFKTVAGTATQLGTPAARTLAFNTLYHIRLVVKGSSINAYFGSESTPAISVTDTSLTAGNYAGIRSQASAANTNTFDNFSVINLSASALAPPTTLSAIDKPGDQGGTINLSWTVSASAGVTQQRIYRGTATTGPYTLIATIADNTTAFYPDTGLINGTTYYYVVRAYNGVESANSNEANAKPIDNVSLAAPTSLTAVDTPADQGKSINLSWTLSAGTGIIQQGIYRGTVTGGPYSLVATVSNTINSYTDTGVTNGTTYFYVVRADNGSFQSANSNQASAVPIDNIAPLAQTNLAIADHSSDQGGAIDLSWIVSTSSDVTQQRIYRAIASGGPYTLINTIAGNATSSYTDVGATVNTTYYYVIRAFDGTQESADSGEASGVSVKNILVTYTYDGPASANAVGRLIQVDDPSGTTQFSYDKMGRVTKTDKTVDAILFSTSTTFDLAGRAKSITYPDSDAVFYTYDGPALTKVSKDAAATINYAVYQTFNALGQPATVTFGNGVTTTYTYSNLANGACPKDNFRLCRITTKLGATTYQDLSYTYDNGQAGVGNITRIDDTLPTDPAGPGVRHTNQTQTFAYDHLNRLTGATGPYGTIAYAYDQIGNMTCNSYLANQTTCPTSNYTYGDATHRHAVTFVRSSADGVTPAVGTTYVYNANGDMVQRGTDTLMYDAQRRLASVINGSGMTNFVYDGDGGRVKKINGTVTSVYIGKLFECVTPCKSGTVWSSSSSKHIYAGSTRIAIKPITTTGDINYFHPDHLGSASVVTDQTGAKKAEFAYLPFGETYVVSGTDFRYKYTGQEKDDTTGLYFYNARYYDARIGRFVSPDTVASNSRDPQDLNRYSYVSNNPLRYTDPTGHWKLNNFLQSVVQVGQVVGAIVITFVCECPAALVPFGVASGMALAALDGGNLSQIINAGVNSGIAMAMAAGAGSLVSGPLVAAGGQLFGNLATVGVGGFVSGSFSVATQGGSARQAIRAGYQGAGISLATAAVMYAVNYVYESIPEAAGARDRTGSTKDKVSLQDIKDRFTKSNYANESDGLTLTKVLNEKVKLIREGPTYSSTAVAEYSDGVITFNPATMAGRDAIDLAGYLVHELAHAAGYHNEQLAFTFQSEFYKSYGRPFEVPSAAWLDLKYGKDKWK